MIVVAIIGILAAVAIPGFMRYIKQSKTAEATDNLNALVKGAQAYYEAEHCFDEKCMQPRALQYPGCGANGAAYTACTQQFVGTIKVVGLKNDPNTTQKYLTTVPWSELKMGIAQPHYYAYGYVSTANSKTDGTSNASFTASAAASLSATCDSQFKVTGTAGSTGNIIDVTDESKTDCAASGLSGALTSDHNSSSGS